MGAGSKWRKFMSDDLKRMCGVKKGLIEKEPDVFIKAASPAKFFCKKCHRVASKKKFLCKPESLKGKK